MLVRRLIATTAAAAVLLSVSVPLAAAAAGGRTIRVDDDGHASAASCGASATAPRRIQPAVDAARPGDTIIVCPGSYRGWVVVRTSGITIKGATPWSATLLPGTHRLVDEGQHLPSMITVSGADDVHIQWLRFRIQAPDLSPAEGQSDPPCGVLAAIRLRDGADDAVIRANRMRAQGPGTLGACGYSSAVLVETGSSALAAYNAARDFRGEAFVATGSGSRMRAVHNSIRYWHDAIPFDQPSEPGVIGCEYGAGIVFSDGGGGSAARNRIVGRPSAAAGRTALMCPGIYTLSAASGVIIRHNLVRWTFDGINTDNARGVVVEDNVILDSPNDGIRGEFATNGRFADNVVKRSGLYGIIVGPEDATAARSAVGHGYGMALAGTGGQVGGTGNRFLDNRSFANGRLDCQDSTTGDGSRGTANTWRGNRSDGHDAPNGICPAA